MVEIGEKYGRLTVTGHAEPTSNRQRRWHCSCDCGGTATTRTDGLTSGRAKSCGCIQREWAAKAGAASRKHDYCDTRTYNSWCHMVGRCYNPKNARYADYGGRGITICDSWRADFLNFLADMGECPGNLTIERKDNEQGYSKDNCYWATYAQQNRNRRPFRVIPTAQGNTNLVAWARKANIPIKEARKMRDEGAIISIRQEKAAS